MNDPDQIFFWVKILKFFDADPGWKKFGSGINIQDLEHLIIVSVPQHWIIVSVSRPPDEIESFFKYPSATSINRLFSCYCSPAAGEDDVIGLERWDAQR